MSSRAATVGSHAAPRSLRRHLRRTAAEPLVRVRRIGYAVLVVQFVGLLRLELLCFTTAMR